MKIKQIILALTLTVMLGGCMTFTHLRKHYADPVKGSVETANGTFAIMDNMQEGRMFVSFTFGGSMTKGTAPMPWAREAAQKWLAQSSRESLCQLTEGYLFQSPYYEFLYACK